MLASSSFVTTRSGTWQPSPVIEIADAVRGRRSSVRLDREGERPAHRELVADARGRLALARPARARSRSRTRATSSSPGSTIRLKRTSSIPAKSASLPRFSSCDERRRPRRPAPSPRPSARPGMIGRPGKWPGEVPLVRAHGLARDHALAGLELEHLVEEEKRLAVGDDRLDHLAAERRHAAIARPCQPLAQARSAHGARSTWPCRPACPSRGRSPRTRSRARPSARPRGPAPRTEVDELGGRARGGARRAPRSRRGSPSGEPAPVLEQRLAAAHALARRPTSRQVLTTRRCSQVANCDSPRNWRSRTQSLASASCAASRASSGSASRCAGEALDPRRMALAECGERVRVAVLGSLDEDGVAELLVDERPLGPRVLPNLTALAERRLHGRPSLCRGERLAGARGRPAAPARPPRPAVRAPRHDAVDAAAARARCARRSARDGRGADRRPRPPRPALARSHRHVPALLATAPAAGLSRAARPS